MSPEETYQSKLSAEQIDAHLGVLAERQRHSEWLLCRYLADIAENMRYRELGYYSDVHHYARKRLASVSAAG